VVLSNNDDSNYGSGYRNSYNNSSLLKGHILPGSNSNQKSFWKNSSNIRINPKNLAPEYYQKYVNTNMTSSSTPPISNMTRSLGGNYYDNTANTEKSKLPKIKPDKKNNNQGKKKNSKTSYGIGMKFIYIVQ